MTCVKEKLACIFHNTRCCNCSSMYKTPVRFLALGLRTRITARKCERFPEVDAFRQDHNRLPHIHSEEQDKHVRRTATDAFRLRPYCVQNTQRPKQSVESSDKQDRCLPQGYEMLSQIAWHSVRPSVTKVFHDNIRCTEGNNIELIYRRPGTGGRRRCARCTMLNHSR